MELEELANVLGPGRRRLWARPGWLQIERPEGVSAAESPFDAAAFAKAQERLAAGPLRLEDGTVAAAMGDVIVLIRPPSGQRRAEDLAADGLLSLLAARLLSASLGIGRNLVITGPDLAAADLLTALVVEGRRGAILAGDYAPVPTTLPRLSRADHALAFGADRLGVLGLAQERVVEFLGRGSGVVATLIAGRLDRTLMRFEAVAGAAAPLRVLAALDLVVVLGQNGRVREVAEIELAEDGYRPRLLFATGLPPVPTALVPVGLPTFVDALAGAGHQVLADELRAASPTAPTQPAARPPSTPSYDEDDDAPSPEIIPPTRRRPTAVPNASGLGSASVVPAPPRDASLEGAPPPGWELDRLDAAGEAELYQESNAEDAMMAATYGLAPPPRPQGVATETTSFDDALARARERDAQMDRDERNDTDDT